MNANTIETGSEQPNAATTQAVESVVAVGRLWAAHGLALGQLGLETSIETLRLAARTLGELRSTISKPTAG